MVVYAKIDFETGDFSQITGTPWLGAIDQSPPDAICEIVSDIVREGKYAMRSYHSNPAIANRSKVILSEIGHWGLKQSYYGFSFYLSPTLKAPDWLQVFEVCQFIAPSNWPHLTQLQVANSTDGLPHLHIVQIGEAPTNALWTSPDPIPLGTWVDIVVYLDIDVNGTVKLWLNRKLMAELHYDTTGGGASPAGYPEFGLYQSADRNPGGNWVVHDRFVLADTLEEASPTPISPLRWLLPLVPGLVLIGLSGRLSKRRG